MTALNNKNLANQKLGKVMVLNVSNNDINHFVGIWVAIADHPGGPFKDYLGEPLVSDFYNDAQPIDQFVFEDSDGTFYFFYGGWSHCDLGRLNQGFPCSLFKIYHIACL